MLHPWTHYDAGREYMMRRRGAPGSPERNLWDRVLAVALDLDDLAGDPGAVPENVPQLTAKVRDLLARLPESGVTPRMPPLVLLDAIDDETTGAASRAALATWLGDAATALAAIAGAPVARDGTGLGREAADVLNSLEPLLAAWTERLAAAGVDLAPVDVAPVVALPPAVRELDDRY